jgi:pyruvate/2-oxoglutarate dehydrogenase complex dihydrolipoamide dehydrogenase (E3) component
LLGGKLDVASRAPSKTTVLTFRDYQARVLRELGVEIHTGHEIDAETIHDEAPDVVLVATGAEPLVPPIPGIGGPTVIDAQEILHDRVTVTPGERFAVIGGSATGCETAEWLIAAGAGVTIVEMLPTVGQGIELITRRHLLADLKAQGVEILTKAKVTMIETNAVLYEHTEDGSRGSLDVDRVATAVGWTPRGASLATLVEGPEVIVLGDASHPGDFVSAINAGADAGLAV